MVMMPQCILVIEDLQSFFGKAIAELYVFVVYPNLPKTQPQNLVLVAPKRALHLTEDDLVERAPDERLAEMAGNLVERIDLSGATVLTDDFSPVEYLVARQLRE